MNGNGLRRKAACKSSKSLNWKTRALSEEDVDEEEEDIQKE
ncbi:MAG: hypothetical protein Q8P67_24855 [archaeon]|nr:hypothetical protein [archaeon]